jgi:hypothetical protein
LPTNATASSWHRPARTLEADPPTIRPAPSLLSMTRPELEDLAVRLVLDGWERTLRGRQMDVFGPITALHSDAKYSDAKTSWPVRFCAGHKLKILGKNRAYSRMVEIVLWSGKIIENRGDFLAFRVFAPVALGPRGRRFKSCRPD